MVGTLTGFRGDRGKMTEKKATKIKLAKNFVSLGPAALGLIEKYRALDESAHENAKRVIPACDTLSSASDELLPILSEMQSLLSQRGENRDLFRDANLPGWEKWWKSFQKKTGMDTTFRNVQLRLRKYRGLEKPTDELNPERPSPPAHWSPQNKVRMLKAVQIGCDLAAAIDGRRDPSIPLHEFQNLRIDSDYIGRQLETLQGHADSIESAYTPAVPAASAAISPAETPAIPQQLVSPAQPLLMPGAGDHSRLFTLVNESCGTQIRASIEGLSPDMMAGVFGEFTRKLINTHCQYDHEAGMITVRVEYAPYKSSSAVRAA
jgi:hypothetical protein